MSILAKVETKLDKIDDSITRIDITLARQSEILDVHVKRTNILEDSLKPIERHVNMVQGAIKLILILGTIAGIIEAIVMLKK